MRRMRTTIVAVTAAIAFLPVLSSCQNGAPPDKPIAAVTSQSNPLLWSNYWPGRMSNFCQHLAGETYDSQGAEDIISYDCNLANVFVPQATGTGTLTDYRQCVTALWEIYPQLEAAYSTQLQPPTDAQLDAACGTASAMGDVAPVTTA